MAATSERRSALQEIVKTAQLLKQRIQSSPNFNAPCLARKPVAVSPPRLDFPAVEPLTSRLIDAGLSSTLSERLSNIHLRRVDELKHQCQSRFNCSYHTVVSNSRGPVAHTAISSVQRTFLDSFIQTSNLWAREQIDKVVAHVQRRQNVSAQKSKATFNHEYIPLLEKYFSYNAYPSARDRLLLARKSMMEPRQIEVWFQNHRTRARKQGISLKRLASDPLPANLALDSIQQDMPLFALPLQHNVKGDDIDPTYEEVNSHKRLHILTPASEEPLFSRIKPPSHVFPTIYPSRPNGEALPSREDTPRFPPVVWPRQQPAQQNSRKNLPLDIEDLIESFQTKLVIRGPKRKSAEYCAWLSTTTTRPSKAPHPALLVVDAVNTTATSRPNRNYGTLLQRNRPYSQSSRHRATPYRRTSLRSLSSSSTSSSLSLESDDGSELSRSPSSRPVTPPVEPCSQPIHIYQPEGFSQYASGYSSPISVLFSLPLDKRTSLPDIAVEPYHATFFSTYALQQSCY